ncbi:MAG: GguC family protein [Planctomycetota bacterium]|nr:GguC family protein [Planctomycetota bacterium]
MRIVQLIHETLGRRVAIVHEPLLHLLNGVGSLYAVAMKAIALERTLEQTAADSIGEESLKYDPIYSGQSEWSLLPPLDHPVEPGNCMVAGTGLTHVASAKNRDAMHAKADESAPVSDSMKMFQWGVEGGKPKPGNIGVQPEWFYKGSGEILRGHNHPLVVPSFAEDGGEEPEIAGLYVIAPNGSPCRLGFSIGNEFSDHIMEKKNYLYLAPSKLRTASIGPELCTNLKFGEVRGEVRIERNSETIWSKKVASGEANMCHSLENLEHHHFKYPGHRRAGDVHVHFFGADAFSFGEGIALKQGDVMCVAWEGMGRALRNPIRISEEQDRLVKVKRL